MTSRLSAVWRNWDSGFLRASVGCVSILSVCCSVAIFDPTKYKKLSYRRVTARCILSVVILPIAMRQCRNYLYDKSWPNWWYEVGGLVGGNVSWTMCTRPWCDRVSSHCFRCHKQTDDGRIVYITCIPHDLLWRNFLSSQCRNCSRDPDHAHLGSTHSSQD